MKINWGTGIVLAFVGFISFIVFFIVKMYTTDIANHELVTDEYYKAELAYQSEIDAQKNTNAITGSIQIEKTEDGLLVHLPEAIIAQQAKGLISLYRPSNKQLDFNLPISLSNTNLLIPDKRLLGGRWDIKIAWKANNKNYLFKKSLTY